MFKQFLLITFKSVVTLHQSSDIILKPTSSEKALKFLFPTLFAAGMSASINFIAYEADSKFYKIGPLSCFPRVYFNAHLTISCLLVLALHTLSRSIVDKNQELWSFLNDAVLLIIVINLHEVRYAVLTIHST